MSTKMFIVTISSICVNLFQFISLVGLGTQGGGSNMKSGGATTEQVTGFLMLLNLFYIG